MRAGSIALVGAGLICGLVPATTDAARSPTRAEHSAIAGAAKSSPYTRSVEGKFLVRRVAVSTRGPWARASLIPKPRYVKTVQGELATFHRARGEWRLLDLGSDGVGCNVGMPPAVRQDLKIVCPGRARPTSPCTNETYDGGRYVGRQTLRFVLVRGVSCSKAHSLIGALYRHVKSGTCEGDRCLIVLPRDWDCSFFVPPETEELGGAIGGCIRTSTGAKFRIFTVLEGKGFLSPDRQIWCTADVRALPGETPLVGCVTHALSPNRGGTVDRDGHVVLCTEETPSESEHLAAWGCFQNFIDGAPVLRYGERAELGGFRCGSERDGITCTTVSGKGAGRGFRINRDEVVQVG